MAENGTEPIAGGKGHVRGTEELASPRPAAVD